MSPLLLKTIVFLPLISSLIVNLISKLWPSQKELPSLVSLTLIFITAGLSLIPVTILCYYNYYDFFLVQFSFNWITCGSLVIKWGFLFDSLTLIMLTTVLTVSSMVHLYSLSYMAEDPRKPVFLSYLSLFTFFMLLLVTADNFLQLFFGWEGVGLCSYLLINFWYTRLQANKAAIKALVVNKIGDCAVILALGLIYFRFKTLNFLDIFYLLPKIYLDNISFFGFEFNTLNTICFFLFVGAMAKSAQIGLHTWLPDAMEGPTPVSALIHAATMVTAGVFLIIRCAPMYNYAPEILSFITVVGGLTAFFAATTALFQYDIKKIIAYSTCSQLGYMMLACGLSAYSAGLFHLVTHAFFKALLFLCAGSVIHACSDEQDIRKMGGLAQKMPITFVSMGIASLTLGGFPFLSGFYSKDLILEMALITPTPSALFGYWLGCFSAILTAFYSFRLIFLVFFNKSQASPLIFKRVHESDFYILTVLIFLTFLSVGTGFFLYPFFLNLTLDFKSYQFDSLELLFSNPSIPALNWKLKLWPTLCSLSGILFAWVLNQRFNLILTFLEKNKINYFWFTSNPVFNFFLQKWYFDKIYNYFLAKPIFILSYTKVFKSLDKGWVEFFGPWGISRFLNYFSFTYNKLSTGYIFDYAFFMLLQGQVLLFVYLFLAI